MKKHPEYAIKSLEEFKGLIDAKHPKIWMVFSHPKDIDLTYNLDPGGLIMLPIMGVEITPSRNGSEINFLFKKSPGHWFTETTGFYFPVGPDKDWFAFPNYWHAYAYWLQRRAKK